MSPPHTHARAALIVACAASLLCSCASLAPPAPPAPDPASGLAQRAGGANAELNARAEEQERVAVLALLNRTQAQVSADEAALLTDVVRNAAQRLPSRRFLVISKESVTVLLPPSTRLEDCVGECAVETGRLMGARWIVTGSVVRFGKGLRVSLALFDTREARQLSAVISKGEGVEGVESSLQADALELLSALSPPLMGEARALRARQLAAAAPPPPAPPPPASPPAALSALGSEEGAEEGAEESPEESPEDAAPAPQDLSLPALCAGRRVTLFIDPTRSSFSPRERDILRDLEGEGCAVSGAPGAGGSNSSPNIKVARGELRLAAEIARLLARHTAARFELRDTFGAGDRDVYINIGEPPSRPRVITPRRAPARGRFERRGRRGRGGRWGR